MKLNDITRYIEEDNNAALAIFDDLRLLLSKSYSEFPKEQNLLGIFFIDLLKLYTQAYLKMREIDHQIVSEKIIGSKLKSWPYLGYAQLMSNEQYQYDFFGKDTSINFAKSGLDKKNLYINLIRLKNSLRKKKNSLSIAGSSSISTKKHIDVLLNNSNLISIRVASKWFFVSSYHDQIKFLQQNLPDLLTKYFSEQMVLGLIDISSKHILHSLSEDDSKNNIVIEDLKDSKFLILGSGLELNNRMLSSLINKKEIPIINVMHGASFGIHDEPVFGNYGEQMYSSRVLGYGKGVLNHASSYKFLRNNEVNYIPSSAEKISKIYKGMQIVTPAKKTLQYYYFPTTLRGSMHRYGPYQDLPDILYLEWQRMLNEIFDGSLITKSHPKEKYSFLYDDMNNITVNAGFSDIEKNIDVFVFDYISTIFQEACATSKPVIFFDLGIRNINTKAMEVIKERTIYYDLSKENLPSLRDLEEIIFDVQKENQLTEEYSLSDREELRSESLIKNLNLI